MLEKEIETKVKEYARNKGWLAYKFTSPGHSFVPDGLFISPKGIVLFMEFKQLGKKPTPGQSREIARIIGHHTQCFVVDNAERGKEIIDENSR